MSILKHIKWFQVIVVGITSLFFAILILAVVIAYSRPSGTTGLDMAKVQIMRQNNSSTYTSQNP